MQKSQTTLGEIKLVGITTRTKNVNEMETLTIQPSTYAKFTSEPGIIPAVVINMWQKIWAMTSNDFVAPRAYSADFEVYGPKAQDHNNAVVEVYIATAQ